MNTSKHILLLGSYAPSILNFRGPLIRKMIASGHRVSVGAPDIGDDVRADLVQLGVAVHDTPLQRNGTGIQSDWMYFKTLKHLIQRIAPDIVLTYTIKPNIWGAFAASRVGVASVAMVTGLGYAFSGVGGGWKSRVSRWVGRKLYRLSTSRNRRVIFQNPDDRDDFLANKCLSDPAKVGIVHGSGVDLNHFERAPIVHAPIFLMIARLLISKGVGEYAQAARLVRQHYPEAQFILVGPHDAGPDSIPNEKFTKWVDDGLISWAGQVDDVRSALRNAAVYVLPSYREGTPRSVLEAMSMGRPIITTDAPGCRETVIDGENGFLVPVQDSTTLAQAMKRFIEKPSLIESMGAKSFEIAQQKYDVTKVNDAVLKLIGIE